ncbi:MAG: DUF2723 domain-containing protein [Pseudomonadales bacterium]|nr:DUF2723 domain-containing protein [Pseudomonadales bacterium]
MNQQQKHLTACVSIFCLGYLLYWLSMPRSVTFEDSGLFLQVCQFGGIAHPPGYPLFSILCSSLFSSLPINPVLLGNSISAAFGAATASCIFLVLRQLTANYLFAVLGAALLLTSTTFWSQAIIIEVYTLNAFLTALALLLAIRFQQLKTTASLYYLALILGLGLANHWPLFILSIPGLVLIFALHWKQLLNQPTKFFAILAGCFIAGLTPYLWLLQTTTEFSYSGPINNLQAFLAYIRRDSFAAVDQQDVADSLDKLRFMTWSVKTVFFQHGPIFCLFAIIGIFRIGLIKGGLIKAEPARCSQAMKSQQEMLSLASGLGVILFCHTILLSLLLGFDYDYLYQAVFSSYLLIAIIVFIIFTVTGIQSCYQQLQTTITRRLFLTCLFGLGSWSCMLNWQQNNRANDTLAFDYANLILTSLPKKSALIVSSDSQTFPIGYRHKARNIRPDVTLLHAKNLFFETKIVGQNMLEFKKFVDKLAIDRPVFSIGVNWLETGKQYGLYLQHQPNIEYKSLNKQYRDFLGLSLAQYTQGKIIQPHDLYFTHQFLYAASLHLLQLSIVSGLSDEEIELISQLQYTFPGTFATLSVALGNPRFRPKVQLLLSMATPFIDNIPDETPNYEAALFYYYLALLDAANQNSYLAISAGYFPHNKNPGYAAWQKLN